MNHGDDRHLTAQPAGPNVSRRSFLQAGAGAVALTAASYGRVLGANDRIGVGFIGYGLIGKRHVLDFQAQEDVACIGLCDAHRGRLEEGRSQLGPGAKGYADFRQLLDDKDIDAVVVSTPDHWHALMTMLVPQFTGAPPVGGVVRVDDRGDQKLWTAAIEVRSGSEAEQFTRHVRNFLDCVKSRETPISDLASSHRVSTMCHLANLSLRVGRKLRWDDEHADVVDDAQASALLVRRYRAPWDAELRAMLG